MTAFFQKNKNLNIIKGDIRDKNKLSISCENHDFFINLSCISNDTSFVLDEKLSKSINFDAFEPMVNIAKKVGIKKDLYTLQLAQFMEFQNRKMLLKNIR